MSVQIGQDFFADDTVTVARKLLGIKIEYNGCAGMIVETEAYRDDAASHAVTKPNKGKMLIDTFGCIYIFFIYGMYHCLNFTTEKNGVGAVLIRAVEPLSGLESMERRRATKTRKNLTNGPGKLFQAFGFNPALHGQRVDQSLVLTRHLKPNQIHINCSSRIGISKARDLQWRFFVKHNKYVSHNQFKIGGAQRNEAF
ncbi:MAG: DNA-3-methyladenine glycosylase [bacterium]